METGLDSSFGVVDRIFLQGHCSADSRILSLSTKGVEELVSAVRGYFAAFNNVFSMAGVDLAASRSTVHHVRLSHQNETFLWFFGALLVHLMSPFKLSLDKHLTWKMCFLLALSSAKRVSVLHGLSFHVRHSRHQRSCAFSYLPDFVAKTQSLLVHDPRFDEFTVPLLDDFMGGDRDELLLFHIRAPQKYLARMEQYHPGISGLFVSMSQRKKEDDPKHHLFLVRCCY